TPACPVNQSTPLPSKVAVLRLALRPGSGNTFTLSSAGSTRTIAFLPPSVTQAAPSRPTITPCGAGPRPSRTTGDSPLPGSRRPRFPLCWAVNQTLPSGAGATSCGPEPRGTAYSCSRGALDCVLPAAASTDGACTVALPSSWAQADSTVKIVTRSG